jgi:hypothetical protein
VLVPDADLVIMGLSTNAAGVLVLSGLWPLGLPPDVDFFMQEWIFDSAGPVGLSASNGLQGTTP